ncbi:MAG: PEP-CTERM sorting domain-containing protein [Burkholderiaceae bacterium]
MFRKSAVAIAIACASSVASAAVWTDIVTTFENGGRVSTSDDVQYQHDILDDGFVPGNTITGFDLKIWLRDDTVTSYDFVCTGFFSCGWVPVTSPDSGAEYGYLHVGATGINLGEVDDGMFSFSFGSGSVLGDLQADGKLSIDLNATRGDFYIDKSVLTATGSAVPLPGALGLIGIGLVGLGVATRRKQA